MEYMNGGSLDLILRKVNRIPENILGKITDAVGQFSIVISVHKLIVKFWFFLGFEGLKLSKR